ncbi:MAG: hemolysin III family protein [Kurthia sp.]|nr:hemolysin III family protein [Candidatus Kurthia equi]
MTDATEDYKSKNEEVWNAITHGIGFILTIPALILLIMQADKAGSALYMTSFIIFGISMMILFFASALLHSVPERYKKICSILDHSSIYILIAGTYTPFALLAIGGKLGWAILIFEWVLAVFGILFKCFFIHQYDKLSLFFYIGMGWVIVLAFKPIVAHISMNGFWMLLIGGLLYTVGAYFYANRKIPYNHAIWHLFVLGGSAMMFLCIIEYV